MFYMIKRAENCNQADNRTLYSNCLDIKEAMNIVEHSCAILFVCFWDIFMTPNAEKCIFLAPGHRYVAIFIKVRDAIIWGNHTKKLSHIRIDSGISFNDHFKMICKKT